LGVYQAALIVALEAEDFDPGAARIAQRIRNEADAGRICLASLGYMWCVGFLRFLSPRGRKAVPQAGSDEQLHGDIDRLESCLDIPGGLELRVLIAGVCDHGNIEGIFGVVDGVVDMQAS